MFEAVVDVKKILKNIIAREELLKTVTTSY